MNLRPPRRAPRGSAVDHGRHEVDQSGKQWKNVVDSSISLRSGWKDDVPWKRANEDRRQGTPQGAHRVPPHLGGALGAGGLHHLGDGGVGDALSPAGVGGGRAAPGAGAGVESRQATLPRPGELLRPAAEARRSGARGGAADPARAGGDGGRGGGERPDRVFGDLEPRALRPEARHRALYRRGL